MKQPIRELYGVTELVAQMPWPSCHLVIVQLVKKRGSTINFLFFRFFVPICQLKKNARAQSAILLICILLKIKE